MSNSAMRTARVYEDRPDEINGPARVPPRGPHRHALTPGRRPFTIPDLPEQNPSRRTGMARSGQLKAKIDLQKKKITEKGKSATPLRQRQLRKRLKRLQRSRRVAAALEARAKKPGKAAAAAEPAPAEPAPAQS